jgi:hypothetical protein
MFVSNKEVVKARHFKAAFIIILFFVNVSMISVPHFYGKMDSVNTIDNLIGIEESLELIYEDELDCEVVDSKMNCNIVNGSVYGNYKLIYSDTFDLDDIDSSVIYMSKENIAIIYVDEYDTAYSISGNYTSVEGLNFGTVKSSDFGELTKDEFYSEMNDYILSSIYFSNLGSQFSLIYMTQFMQVLIYLMVVTILFLLMNFKADVKKLSFYNANKIIVTAMTGPAFLVALLGMFIPTWASIVFFILFAIRIMLLYYQMNFSSETYMD